MVPPPPIVGNKERTSVASSCASSTMTQPNNIHHRSAIEVSQHPPPPHTPGSLQNNNDNSFLANPETARTSCPEMQNLDAKDHITEGNKNRKSYLSVIEQSTSEDLRAHQDDNHHDNDDETSEDFLNVYFDDKFKGKNLAAISKSDPTVIKRVRGCRNSVAISPVPLRKNNMNHDSYFFEVEVLETHDGWVGGLGVGLTDLLPETLPEKAWTLENSVVGGYWGRLFVGHEEMRTDWKADTLVVGDRVGVYFSCNQEFVILVNSVPVVWTESLMNKFNVNNLYPVIDCFAATLSVKFLTTGNCEPPVSNMMVPTGGKLRVETDAIGGSRR